MLSFSPAAQQPSVGSSLLVPPGAHVPHALKFPPFCYGALLEEGSALECTLELTLGPVLSDISLFQQVLRIASSTAAEESAHCRSAEGWQEGLSRSLCLWQIIHTKPGRLQCAESALALRELCVKPDFGRVNTNCHKPTISSSHNYIWKFGLKQFDSHDESGMPSVFLSKM